MPFVALPQPRFVRWPTISAISTILATPDVKGRWQPKKATMARRSSALVVTRIPDGRRSPSKPLRRHPAIVAELRPPPVVERAISAKGAEMTAIPNKRLRVCTHSTNAAG